MTEEGLEDFKLETGLERLGFKRTRTKRRIDEWKPGSTNPIYTYVAERSPVEREPFLEAEVSRWPAGISVAINSNPYDGRWYYDAFGLLAETLIKDVKKYMKERNVDCL